MMIKKVNLKTECKLKKSFNNFQEKNIFLFTHDTMQSKNRFLKKYCLVAAIAVFHNYCL